MNLEYRPYKTWGIGGKIIADGYAIGYIAQYEPEKWIAVAYDKPEGFDQLFPTQADAMLAVISDQLSIYDVDLDAIQELVAPYHAHTDH